MRVLVSHRRKSLQSSSVHLKMWFKFLLLSSAVAIGLSEEFLVVSTSRPSTDSETFKNILTKLETLEKQNAEHKTMSEKASSWLMSKIEKLETQVTELKTSIDSVNANKNVGTKTFPRDCLEAAERGVNHTGIYLIQPKSSSLSFFALCEMEKRGGGWTLILNRFDGSVDFNLDWKSYKDGFGNLVGEFWLGLENIYQLSSYKVPELLVELVENDNKSSYARYKYFSLGSEGEGYYLKILGGFSGDAGDSLAYHAGLKFSTRDKDQDVGSGNCANEYTGGWWYKACHTSHLTGQYKGASNKYNGVCWGNKFNLKEVRMFVRPQIERISFQ